jgi:hypothetical protein
MALVLDLVSDRRMNEIAVVIGEGDHLHTVLFVDDTVLVEFVDFHGDALGRQLLVGDSDFDVVGVGFLKIVHQRLCADRTDDMERRLALAEWG